MKNLVVLIAIGLTLPGFLSAQKQLDSLVTYGGYFFRSDSIRSTKRTYEYNADGRVTAEAIYRWDSIAHCWCGWMDMWGIGKKEYTYDKGGNKISELSLWWNTETRNWINHSKVDVSFDEFGHQIIITNYNWDEAAGIWVPETGQESEYDVSGGLTLFVQYHWNPEAGSWVPWSREDYTLNELGIKTMRIISYWDTITRDWIPSAKYDYQNEAGGHCLSYQTYRWLKEKGVWQGGSRVEYKHDEQWRIIEILGFRDNEPFHKEEYAFDAMGNQISYTVYNWDKGWQNWLGSSRQTNSFDSKGNNTNTVTYLWVSPDFIWVETKKTERNFDATGFKTYEGNFIWSDARKEWLEKGKTIWETNSDRTETIELVYTLPDGSQEWRGVTKVVNRFDSDGDPIFAEFNLWWPDNNNWFVGMRNYYFYRPQITGIEETYSLPISIFPIPTNGLVFFTGLVKPAEVQVYSLQGALIKRIGNVMESADLTDLPAGSYVMHVSDGRSGLKKSLRVTKQ